MLNILYELTKRDIKTRYKGTALGIAWSFALPLAMLAVYSIVFGYIFPSRWSPEGETTHTFPLYLFAGMLPYMYTAETLNRSTTIIRENAYLVKKVSFPLPLTVLAHSLSSALHMLTGLIVLAIASLATSATLTSAWFVALSPLALLPLFFFVTASALFIASLAVFMRDTTQLISATTPALMFLSPVFFPVHAAPEPLRQAMAINPLTPTIEWLRDMLLRNQFPDSPTYAMYLILSLASLIIAMKWFNRLQPAFADKL